MPDIFISYSKHDEAFAQFLYRHLTKEDLKVFMASVSLKPGQKWGQEILNNLKASRWVFFLASRAASESQYVQQELGAALATDKNIVPIVWDMTPSDLPGWINERQALNLRGATLEQVSLRISDIAKKMKADILIGQLFAGLALAGLFYFASKG